MALIRKLLGSLILFFDWAFTPRGVKREPSHQALIDEQTSNLSLYHYKACPFCVKVRRAMKRQSLSIQAFDAKRCEQSKSELIAGGGALKVPCLRIDEGEKGVTWMYESDDIIDYLQNRVAAIGA